MSVLHLFVLEEELDQIICGFATLHKLAGCSQKNNNYRAYDPKISPSEFLTNRSAVSVLYLFPETSIALQSSLIEGVRPRDMGWIQIDPGGLKNKQGNRELIVSTIQAENKNGLPFKAANWLRQLKKELSKSLIFGVKGQNIIHGGSHIYQDMCFSQNALSLYQNGIHWKQHDVRNTEFSPSNP